ncbi:hypothetical protein [Streptomyces sp. IMTB 2501]|uniref:hypothetical protein n=1 Tax=Streptomyces sp. IMTB 2501 TaxID=1776340 RepID=UPI0015C10CED|nr:hypothetical protein [Streptomyces sp. IMTB 2501]
MHRTSDRSRDRRDGNTHAADDSAEHPYGDQLPYARPDVAIIGDPAPDLDEGTRRDAGPTEPEPDALANVGRGVLPLARHRPDTPSPGSP